MGLATNARGTAAVPGKILALRRTRQPQSAAYSGTTEHQLGDAQQHPSADAMRDLAFVTASCSSCFSVAWGARSEADDRGDFPAETLRRREVFVVWVFLCVSASLRGWAFVIALWNSCFTTSRGAVIRGGGVGRVCFLMMGRFFPQRRRDAETQRGFRCVVFSLRLCGTGRSLNVLERISTSDFGSTKNPGRACRLQFDGVGEKLAGYCCRARKNISTQTQTTVPVS